MARTEILLEVKHPASTGVIGFFDLSWLDMAIKKDNEGVCCRNKNCAKT